MFDKKKKEEKKKIVATRFEFEWFRLTIELWSPSPLCHRDTFDLGILMLDGWRGLRILQTAIERSNSDFNPVCSLFNETDLSVRGIFKKEKAIRCSMLSFFGSDNRWLAAKQPISYVGENGGPQLGERTFLRGNPALIPSVTSKQTRWSFPVMVSRETRFIFWQIL